MRTLIAGMFPASAILTLGFVKNYSMLMWTLVTRMFLASAMPALGLAIKYSHC
jgi:hypothetical protein